MSAPERLSRDSLLRLQHETVGFVEVHLADADGAALMRNQRVGLEHVDVACPVACARRGVRHAEHVGEVLEVAAVVYHLPSRNAGRPIG